MQWSRLLHLWSSKEATGEKNNNNNDEKNFFEGFTVCKTGKN